MLDLAVVGAGPCGLAVGAAARRAGLAAALFDRGPLAASLMRYPVYMNFFSTAEKLEIAGVPFTTAAEHPTRREALAYFRRVAEHFTLDVRGYHAITGVTRADSGFRLRVEPRGQAPADVDARHVVFATGYFDSPNRLGVPGEDLPHVSHFFTEAHPYWRQNVVVVGGGNSAVETALELHRVGARVTIVHFGSELDPGVKPWVRPDITNRLKEGAITAHFGTRVAEIRPTEVVLQRGKGGRTETVAADAVLAMTGYHTDHAMLTALGVHIAADTGVPEHDPETMETNVPGVYLAGVIAAGRDANKIFIENGRDHGERICRHVARRAAR